MGGMAQVKRYLQERLERDRMKTNDDKRREKYVIKRLEQIEYIMNDRITDEMNAAREKLNELYRTLEKIDNQTTNTELMFRIEFLKEKIRDLYTLRDRIKHNEYPEV